MASDENEIGESEIHEEHGAVNGHANGAIPFVRGSETSEEAAVAKGPTKARDEAKVLGFIHAQKGRGATDDEIEVGTGLCHQSASARRNGLVAKGLLHDGGGKRLTRRKRRAIVWLEGSGGATPRSPKKRAAESSAGSSSKEASLSAPSLEGVPSAKEIQAASENIGRLVAYAKTEGIGPGKELQKLLTWLEKIGN